MTKANKTEIEGIVRKVLNQEQNGYGEATFGARGAPGTPPDEETDIEPAVRKALSDVFNEVADELSTGEDDQDDEDEPGAEAAGTELELGSMRAAKTRGQSTARSAGIRGIIILLKKSPALYRAARKFAVRGARAFKGWVNGLSSFNPVKWAILALPQAVFMELVQWLASQARGAASTRGAAAAAPGAGAVEPDEIEHVVRRVLIEALGEPPQESASL